MSSPTPPKPQKVTPWFPWNVAPVRAGWYELRGYNIDEGMPMMWSGCQWGYWIPNPINSVHQMWVHWAMDSTDEWRGLARKP